MKSICCRSMKHFSNGLVAPGVIWATLLVSFLPIALHGQELGGCEFDAASRTCANDPPKTQCDDGTGKAGKCTRLGDNSCECFSEHSPRGYVLNVQPNQAQVRPNVNANYTVTVTPSGGYSGTVEIDCSFGGRSMTCLPQHQTLVVPGDAHVAVATPLQGKYGITFTGKDQQNKPAINGDQTATLTVTNGGGSIALGTLAGLLTLCVLARIKTRRSSYIEC